MKEACVIIPNITPDGFSTFNARQAMAAALRDTFGGYTKAKAYGSDPTTPRGEQVWVYTVAMTPNHDNDAKLVQIAVVAWDAAKQAFGYIRLASGDVSIVDVPKAKKTGFVWLPSGIVPWSPNSWVSTEGFNAA